MAATKFVRVSCTLPIGVVLASRAKGGRLRPASIDAGFGLPDVNALLDNAIGVVFESSSSQSASSALVLTLDVPQDQAAETAKALQSMVEDLLR